MKRQKCTFKWQDKMCTFKWQGESVRLNGKIKVNVLMARQK